LVVDYLLRPARFREQVELERISARPTVRNPTRSYAVSRVNVAVAVADEAQSRIYEVAAACRAVGLAHTSTLAMVGVLTGSMEVDDLAKLFGIPGVMAVEVEYRFRAGTTATVQ
jgi:hypothetical protein